MAIWGENNGIFLSSVCGRTIIQFKPYKGLNVSMEGVMWKTRSVSHKAQIVNFVIWHISLCLKDNGDIAHIMGSDFRDYLWKYTRCCIWQNIDYLIVFAKNGKKWRVKW